jgi:hypothetical protein
MEAGCDIKHFEGSVCIVLFFPDNLPRDAVGQYLFQNMKIKKRRGNGEGGSGVQCPSDVMPQKKKCVHTVSCMNAL